MTRRANGNRTGSYFFVIDACIAMIILIGGLLIVTQDRVYSPTSTQAFAAAEDYMHYLESSEIGTMDAPIVRTWLLQENVTAADTKILYQLALFNLSEDAALVGQLANLTLTAIPVQTNARVIVSGIEMANRGGATWVDADIVLTSKRIVIVRSTALTVAAPIIVEVQTWQ